MQGVDIVRAWKDADYRVNLTTEELTALPTNPLGELEFGLSEAELALINGGTDSEEALAANRPMTFSRKLCYTWVNCEMALSNNSSVIVL
jgi:mersacidin/lichenicidin family type 2 lantibiotic